MLRKLTLTFAVLLGCIALLAVSADEAQAQFNPDEGATGVGDCPEGTNIIVGTDGNDNLRGTNGDDCIVGGGGNDNINGRGGNDFIIGGDGNDTIRGGNGNDILFGGNGNDVIRAGRGNDLVFGGKDNDRISGSRGQDVVYGQDGDDVIGGGSGDDVVDGGAGNDDIRGGRNDDLVIGGEGDDILRAGSGDDFLLGGGGDNTLRPGRGLDSCDFALCAGEDDTLGLSPSAFLVSASNTRSNPTGLQGAIVNGNIYAFIADNDTAVVRFYLDDPNRENRPILTDSRAPFDFCGSNDSRGVANPFPTPRFTRNGLHSVTAEIEHNDGSTEVITSFFTVDN